MNITTKRFPRTLGQAFRGAEYGCAFTVAHESLFSRFRRWMRETFKQGA